MRSDAEREQLAQSPRNGGVTPQDWSPEGGEILAVLKAEDESQSLVAVAADRGTLEVLRAYPPKRRVERTRYSPDGRLIACTQREEGVEGGDVFVTLRHGGAEVPLVESPNDDRFIAWIEDGEVVLVSSDRRAGRRDLWRVEVHADGSPGKVTTIAKDFYEDIFAQREGRLYYFKRLGEHDVLLGDLVEGGLIVRNVRPVSRLYASVTCSADWSSSRNALVYRATRDGKAGGKSRGDWVLVSNDLDTDDETVIDASFVRDSYMRGPRWSPDEASLLVYGETAQGTGVHLVSVEDGTTERLLTSHLMADAVWSPDGRFVYARIERRSIVRLDLQTRETIELFVSERKSCDGLDLSPDGSRLAFTTVDGRIVILSTQDGSVVRVLPPETGPGCRLVSWSRPGGEHVYVLGTDDRKLWRLHLESGERQPVDIGELELGSGARIMSLATSPGGERIVITMQRYGGELWVTDAFLQGS